MVRDRTSTPFINQRPSSWFLFYLYFILLSLPIIITNRSLNLNFLLNHNWVHHNISSESHNRINYNIYPNQVCLVSCQLLLVFPWFHVRDIQLSAIKLLVFLQERL